MYYFEAVDEVSFCVKYEDKEIGRVQFWHGLEITYFYASMFGGMIFLLIANFFKKRSDSHILILEEPQGDMGNNDFVLENKYSL